MFLPLLPLRLYPLANRRVRGERTTLFHGVVVRESSLDEVASPDALQSASGAVTVNHELSYIV